MTKVEKKEDRTLVMTDSGEIISDSRFEVMPAHPRSISDARRARYLRATIDSVSSLLPFTRRRMRIPGRG